MVKRSAAEIAKAMMAGASSSAPATRKAPAPAATPPKRASPKPAATRKAAAAAAPPPKRASAKPSAARGTQAQRAAAADGAALSAAIAAGNGAVALAAALAWWRATRAPALADLIDAVSDRVSGPLVTTEVDFTNLALAKDPLDLGRMLPALRELPVNFLPTASKLLAEYPDDPRIARAVVGWTTPPITTSTSKNTFWTTMFEITVRTRDVRAVAGLKKRLAKEPEVSEWWERFYGAIRRVITTLEEVAPAPVALPEYDLRTLAQVARPASVRGGTQAPTARGSLLAQALAHVAAGRLVDAIDAMVARWREVRAPKLADLIDRATRLLPTYDMPLAPRAELHAAWTVAFRSDPQGAMPQLLQNVDVGDRKLRELRLVQLATLPDDPRIAWRFAELAASGGTLDHGSFRKPVFGLLVRTADPRTREVLRAVYGTFTNPHYGQANRVLSKFALSNEPAPELGDPELVALEAALRRVPLPEWDLIDRIVEDWRDPAPRLVYADWLQERGHPRGELIALDAKASRSPGEQKRLDELLDMPYLFGAIDDIVDRGEDGTVCEHGFYRAIAVDFYASPAIWRRLAACPQVLAIERMTLRLLHEPLAGDFEAFVRRARHLRQIELDDARTAPKPKGFARKGLVLRRS